MMALVDQFALSQNGAFQQRVEASAVNAAIAISTESGTTTDHANRLALAQQVLLNPGLWAQRMALAVVEGSANLQTAAPNNASAVDSDINTSVSSIWNAFADGLNALQTAKVI